MQRGDIVWATNTANAEHIINKKRPYIIVSNNACNENSNLVTAIPLTTVYKRQLPIHWAMVLNGKINIALCEQITMIAKNDITEFIDIVSEKDMKGIENCIKIQLGLE